MVTVSFPGIGIGEFNINPVAFEIPILGGIQVRWYGILITTGIILAFLYCAYRAKQEQIKFDHLLDIAIYTVIFAVIGARTGYVLFSLSDYTKYLKTDGFWFMVKKMLSINEGGLQIYGAIIAGAITIFIVCKIKKISTLKMLDAVAPAVMIGQIIGRWGNFCNGEAHGSVVPETSPLYFIRMGLSTHNIKEFAGKMAYVHPTFLYESLWNLIGFVIIHFLYKKKKFDGQVVLMYLTWYGFGRMFIESLRTDQLKIGVFPVSIVIGAICFVGGSILLTVKLIKARRATITAGEYAPTYAKLSHYGENTATAAEATDEAAITEEENEIDATPEEDEPAPDKADETTVYREEIMKRFSDLLGDDSDKNTDNKENDNG